jgi:aminocarboxymuconate-semialdehyde decarboxylase
MRAVASREDIVAEQAVVDVHNHAVPGRFVDIVRREGARYGFGIEAGHAEDARVNLPSDVIITTPDGLPIGARPQKSDEMVRQREMAGVGIDLRLQSVSPGMMSYGAGETQAEWFSRSLSDAQGADMKEFPDKVSAMATVPLQFARMAVRELERVTKDYGMRSVQIATNVNGENLDQPQFSPFWEAAQGLGMLVFIHPRYQVGKYRMARYSLSNLIGNPLETTIAAAHLIFGGVLERYPELKVVLAHGGGMAPWVRGRWRHGIKERRAAREGAREAGATKPFEDYFGRLYFDTLLHDEAALRYLVETVGADHVLLGTDYPADMGDWEQVSWIRGMTWLSEDDKERILGGNAMRLVATD